MKAFNCFAIAALALGLSSIPAWSQVQQEPQQQPTQSQNGQAGDQPSQQVQAFTGTIVKTSDGYVLQDSAGTTSYKLDNAKQAKKFEGKNVKVTGTLDVATNTIHISNVEMASASY
jgi:hypothetical protein